MDFQESINAEATAIAEADLIKVIIKKGTKLDVEHSRKGHFIGIAEKDFSLDDEWYPIILADGEYVEGMNTDWEGGERISCRASLTQLKKLGDEKNGN